MSLSYPYTFKINNTDFKSYVLKYGYNTGYTPVYSDTITTLDKVDHNVILRWKHSLTVQLKPLSEAELLALQTALGNATVASIKFSSLQLNTDVTANMVLNPSSADIVLKNTTRRVLGNITLTFTQL